MISSQHFYEIGSISNQLYVHITVNILRRVKFVEYKYHSEFPFKDEKVTAAKK